MQSQPTSLTRRLDILRRLEALGEALLRGPCELDQVQSWLHERGALLAELDRESAGTRAGLDMQGELRASIEEAAQLIERIAAQGQSVFDVLARERDAVAGALRKRRQQGGRANEPRLVSRRA